MEITLNPTETQLLALIDFGNSDQSTQKNQLAAKDITLSLLSREAIPHTRLRYFTDPTLNINSTKKSHRQTFESNGLSGDDIFQHPHFLKYLKYFLYGPDLPPQAIDEFCQFVSDNRPITSKDVEMLCQMARKATQQFWLPPQMACEEFHKLALELGIDDLSSRLIRDYVLKTR
jgi:hypothetical protein